MSDDCNKSAEVNGGSRSLKRVVSTSGPKAAAPGSAFRVRQPLPFGKHELWPSEYPTLADAPRLKRLIPVRSHDWLCHVIYAPQ